MDSVDRFTLFPIKHPKIWNLYETHRAMFWVAQEVDLSKDFYDFQTMSKAQQRVVEVILAFFAWGDGVVIENLASNFLAEVNIAEARQFYSFQIAIEAIHSEMYNLHLNVIARTPERIQELNTMVLRSPELAAKMAYMERYMDGKKPLVERLVAYGAVEGILFCSSFACIFYLKTLNLLPGLTKSNEFISRDENLHRDMAVELVKTLVAEDPEANLELADKISEIVKEAVDVEVKFMKYAIQAPLLGLNAKSMESFIEYIADDYLHLLGVAPMYNSSNPFAFMETISSDRKSNFFESRPSEYVLAASTGPREFSLSENF